MPFGQQLELLLAQFFLGGRSLALVGLDELTAAYGVQLYAASSHRRRDHLAIFGTEQQAFSWLSQA